MHAHTHNTAPDTEGAVIHWAWAYDWTVQLLTLGRAKALRRRTVALAAIQPGERILEVGCGTGEVALLAATATGPTGFVAGIDAAPEMIARAQQKAERRRAAVDYRIGVVEALDFPDASFDVVLSSLMMHHLPPPLKPRGLAEIRRVLKPGGRLLVVDIAPEMTREGHHARRILLHSAVRTGPQDLETLLRESGFSRIEAGPVRPLPLGYVRGWVA